MTTFPKDFLWSASTAATQIEGGWNADGKGESIWDTLVHDGTGKIAHGENADISIDFYHRWREDVALMKQMGLKAYRFSISWARVLPEGIGKVNEAGIRFYQDFCDELLKNGIIQRPSEFFVQISPFLQNGLMTYSAKTSAFQFCDLSGQS